MMKEKSESPSGFAFRFASVRQRGCLWQVRRLLR